MTSGPIRGLDGAPLRIVRDHLRTGITLIGDGATHGLPREIVDDVLTDPLIGGPVPPCDAWRSNRSTGSR